MIEVDAEIDIEPEALANFYVEISVVECSTAEIYNIDAGAVLEVVVVVSPA